MEAEPAQEMGSSKRKYSKYITQLKPQRTERKPFIVADFSTVIVEKKHASYAAGLMKVRPSRSSDHFRYSC